MSKFVNSIIQNATSPIVDDDSTFTSLTLFTLLQSISNNYSCQFVAYYDLGYFDVGNGLFEIGDFHIQLSGKQNEKGEFSHYELIIADNISE